ncbi:hypothetical protein HU200_010195 [Digitaria exilis]|uniref:Uncharacterized protein n=1 Tax=Digitaria exilis TaxID=1010633 RepID=A0A835KNT2_9POAL|nr:hypothetical protein HU200_010195 [Digitaria exilis]CAB3481972.1 unnamed protein product [Digitaria exilis]
MAIAGGVLDCSPLHLSRTRRRAPLPPAPSLCSCFSGEPRRFRPCLAASLPPAPAPRDEEPRESSINPAQLLAGVAAAAAAAASPRAALAASGGVMGGRSYSSSSRSSSSTSSSSSSFSSSSSSSSSSWSSPSSSSSSSSWSSPSSSSSSSSTSSWSSPSSSTSSTPQQQAEGTHVSVGTAQPPPLVTAAGRGAEMRFWGYLASASVSAAALFLAARHYTRPRTTVVKLQVALLGLAKSFQKDLNEIAEKVEASNQRWYKFILTETICSMHRHSNCCISSSLSVDVTDSGDSWEHHFDKNSIEERSKFDEETLYNLEGIKKKKSYSRKPDGFRNEYIVLTILVAADGALKFPEVRSYADLEVVVEKLNSIPARQIQGIQVLWTPQDENDVLLEEKLQEDYPYLKPLCDD